MESSCTVTNYFGGSICLAATTGYTTEIYNSIAEVPPALWHQIVPQGHTFLNYDYLNAFELSCSGNMSFRYVVFRKDGRLAGVAAFQSILFDGNNIGNEESKKEQTLWTNLLNGVVNRMKLRILVLGNTFMTGEYGWYFTDAKVLGTEELAALQLATQQLIKEAKQDRKPISALLVKDTFVNNLGALPNLQLAGYLQFPVQPDMILDIDPIWKLFDDYLGAMSSKYRVRMRKAIKDMNGVEIRPMTIDEVQANLHIMEHLYQEVINSSSFKMATFELGHVPNLLRTLPANQFWVDGFWLDGKLVAFISFYKHENQLVAGMMGMDRSAQRTFDLYLNVLLLVARRAIENGMKQAVYGRTAMEIKSSVGALPHDMYLYTRHVTGWKNRLLLPIVKRLSTSKPWHQRNPFK
ncbi:hypothetical protein BH09BAC1_BH09BAC1_15300 [soil metagenome]